MNYLTQPAVAGADDALEELLADFWISSQPSAAADQMGWDTLEKLRAVPYGIYLAFEEGRNCWPMVLAWRDQPELNLACYDDVGYELHAVGQPGHRLEAAPEPVARFHEPVDALIVELSRRVADGDPAQLKAAMLTVATLIAERIEQHMVLRPAFHDDDGDPEGLGPDLAPGLTAAWKAWLAKEN